jgi:hypothetical protein
LIGIYEVILANIGERSEFDIHLFREDGRAQALSPITHGGILVEAGAGA